MKLYVAYVRCANHTGNPKFGSFMFPVFMSLEELRKKYDEPIQYFIFNEAWVFYLR